MSKTRNLGNLTDLLTAGSTYVTTATPPQFDNNPNLATTAWVKTGGLRYSLGSPNGGTSGLTLTAANAGQSIMLASTFTGTITLPSSATMDDGETISIVSGSNVSINVVCAGTDVMFPYNSSITSLTLATGDDVQITKRGPIGTQSVWFVTGGSAKLKYSAQFGTSQGANGYQKLPSGLIIQWGAAGSNASGVATLTLPIAFPSTFIIGVANYLQAGAGVQSVVATISTNSTASTLVATASSANAAVNGATVYFMAIGK